jgi:hypothetical protein
LPKGGEFLIKTPNKEKSSLKSRMDTRYWEIVSFVG